MLVIGLTGGIACGKSTVSRRLKNHHKIPIVDADKLARDVVQPGEDAYNQIVEHFQPKIHHLVLADNQLDRSALGKYVFENPEELKVLNGITHPAIRYKIFSTVFDYYIRGYSMCVVDVPLLFETNLDVYCGLVITVVCKNEIQLQRLLARNSDMTLEEAENRINSQISNDERVERSDFVLRNNFDIPSLYSQIDTVMEKVRPSFVRTALEYFPPFGVVSAASVVISKRFLIRWRRKRSKHIKATEVEEDGEGDVYRPIETN
ncbi:hypothetical protein Kpol_340p3 [Vanderwaltozyma polyspora DSM 70294]|uniref:Dephospho-CoA kinase n=1 Tax=Vanderwaltozyma polyspora (strain ATCC 22028 / DSM 70294 / BCRC 21397 / CBS 2163 / NBRC 10782 / NRRL Y-8283 / UCD 57-17) TaxID=436907 RepID=A7TSU8_VANPO|nr:uncharacterized protein Kpol_340p3 [Vanderwaltozyma polyspora DSM 70294]EDO14656.1 hypothetical protein Kpol_340p3 [Vanderwaltozyma polyspora DSM 70294]